MLTEHPLYRELSGLIAGTVPQVRRTTHKRLAWFVADRAFGNPAFTDVVEGHGWTWVVRLQFAK